MYTRSSSACGVHTNLSFVCILDTTRWVRGRLEQEEAEEGDAAFCEAFCEEIGLQPAAARNEHPEIRTLRTPCAAFLLPRRVHQNCQSTSAISGPQEGGPCGAYVVRRPVFAPVKIYVLSPELTDLRRVTGAPTDACGGVPRWNARRDGKPRACLLSS